MNLKKTICLVLTLVLVLGSLPLPVQAAPSGRYSVTTDKEVYAYGESIIVTATGNNCWVGIYAAGDTPGSVESYCWYYTKDYNNKPVAIQGTNVNSRFTNAGSVLPAGDYVVYLFQTANGSDYNEMMSRQITIEAGEEEDSGFSLTTNKTYYSYGEDILVTATGEDCWVGIYGSGESYGSSGSNSYFWYYTSSYPGVATVIQETVSNGRAEVLPTGTYVIYLFQSTASSDYNVKLSTYITVADGALEDLTSITYQLDEDTDGFANGTVTVTKTAGNTATDCVLYWADANGDPLPGYTSLAKFKLTGDTTTHEMYTHTVIPQGAEKLIAYASSGGVLSQGYVSADLPEDCAFQLPSSCLAEFQIVSDTHVREASHDYSLHFAQLLEDVRLYSPDSLGIFINGDVTDSGTQDQYDTVVSLYQASAAKGLSAKIHISIGNHDWNNGNPNSLFQTYVKKLNSTVTQPSSVYYSETVGGYNFIFLGSESSGLYASLSSTQLSWLDQQLAAVTAQNSDQPVFVLLHQAVYNTVAGTLPGQGWHGVNNEDALKAVLKKYPQVILFGGHSHWELNSLQCLYPGDSTMSAAMNTASVGYLWSSYDVITGEQMAGSHGYYVRIYDDYVLFLGREIEQSAFIPSAMFLVRRNKIEAQDSYTVNVGSTLSLGGALDGGTVTYASSDTSVATVSADGRVTGMKEGTAKISVFAPGTDTTVVDRKTVTVTVQTQTHSCKDGDTDHDCDICGATMGEHKNGVNSHICAYCGKSASTCTDSDTDHDCDICGATMGEHKNGVNSHICAYCGKAASECADGDTDHDCDICGATMGEHKNGVNSHICAYCGKAASTCADGDTDHDCDICGTTMGEHKNGVNSHICAYCGKAASTCADSDTDKDHKCDVCGKENMNPCADISPKDHICDICETVLGICRDENGDNTCDDCLAVMCNHVDEDIKDHLCDKCGKTVSNCGDKTGDGDHACDHCGEENITTCADSDHDHDCDECTATMGIHAGTATSHTCAYCGKAASTCADGDSDHDCDICGKTLSPCEDADADYKCDICGKELDKPEPDPTEPDPTEPDPTEPDPTEPDPTEPAGETEVVRLAGATRFETALMAADRMKEDLGVSWFDAVIVASGTSFADALSGSYLAAVKSAPILLSYKQAQNDRVKAYILDNLAPNGTVYILGGTAAVPASMEEGLEEYNVVRLAGKDRFETNLEILEEAGVKRGQEILVCTGTNFADSLSAAATGYPILLVYKKLSAEQRDFLDNCPATRATVIGGKNAVSTGIEEAVTSIGYSVGRLGGENRFETSVLIAERFFEDVNGAVLAYAMNFPDGLCGGAVAHTMGVPLVLTMTGYSDAAEAYLADKSPETLLVLGGKDLISDKTLEAITENQR